MSPDRLPVALRAYAVPIKPNRRRRWRGLRSPPPQQRTIVFDTESTTDPSQRLTFGASRYYVDRQGTLPATHCVEETVFHADDLEAFCPGALDVLRRYAETHRAEVAPGRARRLLLRARREWAERVLFKRGVLGKATIVCFNVPFDLSRIAIDATEGRDANFGGNSLVVLDKGGLRPRITTRALDSKRSLLGLTRFKDSDGFRGDFVDCRTFDFALTGEAASLERACSKWGVEYVKRDVTHGQVTDEYVTYCREDVWATAQLYRALVAELRRHPIDLEPSKAFSPASVGKAYLRALGVLPVLRRQPRFKKRFLAMAMEAFYGGRAECRIRRCPVPVVHTDFTSMYPTVNALMGIWALTIAQRIDVEDATEDARAMIEDPISPSTCSTRRSGDSSPVSSSSSHTGRSFRFAPATTLPVPTSGLA